MLYQPMPKISVLILSLAITLGASSGCFSQSYGPIEVITPAEKNTLWINPGLYSYHFDQNRDFNSVNYGLGLEYQFSTVASITVGTYRNSYYQTSNYVGAYWMPLAVDPFHLGVVAGGFNGYSNTQNGGWFPAMLPVISIEGEWVGLNLIVIPSIADRVAGSLSFQLKIKAFN